MCGRFVQLPIHAEAPLPWPALRADFALLPARYNLAPGQSAAVLVQESEAPALRKMHWGLMPFWAKELALGQHTFNARLETLDDKPAFRAAFKARHAAVPMAGYYEWRSTPAGKQPYYFHPERAGDTLWVAALWEPKHPLLADDREGSFTLVTQAADGLPAEVHPRMPVFLEPREVAKWLTLAPGPSMPFLLTRALPALKMHAVAKRVNAGRENDAALIEPIAPA